jgi:FKBP-type peptidyl-prolyl cis-trans isomerase FklB
MKTITLALAFYLSVGCLAGYASSSKPAGKPAGTNAPTPIEKTPAGTNWLSDEKARVSYAIGMNIGHNFVAQAVEVDPDVLIAAIKDTLAGKTTLLTQQEMRDTLTEFQKTMMAKQQKRREELALKNRAEGEAFLAKNKTQPGVVTMPDGLQYKVITNGNGAMPAPTDVVTVNYRGTLVDGTEFDNSAKHGRPAQFGVGNVIPGWTEALTHMKVGSKWQVFIPSELAYGERGRPNIPPNSVLIFEMELLNTEAPAPVVSTNAPLTSDIIKVPSLDEMKKGAKIEVIKPEDLEKAQAAQTNRTGK